jgi:hypothetical protein
MDIQKFESTQFRENEINHTVSYFYQRIYIILKGNLHQMVRIIFQNALQR